jgi:MFS family permease
VIPHSDDNESALKVFVRAVRDCRPQRLVLAMLLCYGIFVSPFVALLPVLAETLTGNSKNVGWLSAVYFAGGTVSILSGYVSTRINIPLAARTFLACGLSGLWLFAIVVSLSTTSGTLLIVLGGAFTFLFGHASTMLLSVFNVAAQEFSPGHQRRRILSALILLGATVGTAAVLIAGWWTQVQSLTVVLLTCAIGLIAFAVLQLRWRKASNVAPAAVLVQ